MSSINRRLRLNPTLADPHATKLHVENAQITNQILEGNYDSVWQTGVGVVLQSPDGHYWRLSVDNAGAISAADLGTDRP